VFERGTSRERYGYCYENLRQAVMDDRFSDKLPDRYYYRRLQDAAQGRGASAEDLGGRYRKLCRRTVWKVQDEIQRIINEKAECVSLVYPRAQGSSGAADLTSDA
jgi:hypothetical protein